MADRLRTTAIAIVDKLGQLSALALLFFHTLHNQLSQRPARSSPASTPSPSGGESCGPVAGDLFHFVGCMRKNGRLYARVWETKLRFEWRFPFNETRCDLYVPPRIPRSVADEALGACLAYVAEERGHAA